MFDVGFSELVLIGIVAVVVLGPEKLPKVARTCGLIYGKAQKLFAGVKEEIERDMALEKLRKVSSDAKSQMDDIHAHLADVHADLSGISNNHSLLNQSRDVETIHQ